MASVIDSNEEIIPNKNQPAAPVREDFINTAVKFLQNPKVINSPLIQKQKFLQRRGLSDEEIRIACERSGAFANYEQTVNQPPPLPLSSPNINNNMINPYAPYGQMQISFFDKFRLFVQSIALFSIAAYIIQKFYEDYIAPFLFGRKKKSISEKIDDLEKNVDTCIKDISKNLGNVISEIDKISYTSENEISELRDLKSEVATVKGLLLTSKQFPSVGRAPLVPPSIPAWQMSSVNQGEQEQDNEENKEELLEIGSGSGSSEPEHGMKTSESSLEIINQEDL